MIWASAKESTDERATLKALVYDSNQPNADALKSALDSLLRLKTDLAAFRKNLDEEFLPPLLPFWLDAQDDLGPKLSKALLEWAGPATELVARQFDRAVRYGEGISDSVKRAQPRPDQI